VTAAISDRYDRRVSGRFYSAFERPIILRWHSCAAYTLKDDGLIRQTNDLSFDAHYVSILQHENRSLGSSGEKSVGHEYKNAFRPALDVMNLSSGI